MIAFEKQYAQKQSINYFLATKLNLFILLAIYFFSDNLMNLFLIYPTFVLLAYRFFYDKTKLDNPYNTFLYEKFIILIRKIRISQ
ncbi:hypothetical protein LMG7974_01586 [Campylobacter majalis]|uniref:Uncharacterized protein n=1 Tax=Campylobacter majalis TaxID=2790656 RepID=A0ABM8Q948_9BACT|nr:hypothetical protein LMG7974_01586 [Campylobacter majalis]